MRRPAESIAGRVVDPWFAAPSAIAVAWCYDGVRSPPPPPATLAFMIVVQGVFRVAAEDREKYIAQSLETQRISRSEPGCIEYALAGDPLEPDRVVLSERWASRAALDAHLTALTARRQAAVGSENTPIEPTSREIVFFDAAAVDVM